YSRIREAGKCATPHQDERDSCTVKHMLITLSMVGLLLSSLQPVAAHGTGKQVLKQVEAEPYVVSVWVDPENPVADRTLHVTISVEYNGSIMQAADVQVVATSEDGEEIRVNAS